MSDVSNRREATIANREAEERAPYLARHRDADGVLRRDEVVRVLGGLRNGELDTFDSAVEPVATRPVVWGNGSAGVLADIAAVIGGEDHCLSYRYGALADFFAIDKERRLASLAEAPASVGEFHANLMVAGGQRVSDST